MKKLLFILLTICINSTFADELPPFEMKEKIVKIKTSEVEVALNEQTVLCSAADYSGYFLKVLIPQLADLTVFNHRNIGAGAPCVAAGPCDLFGNGGNTPDDIIDPNRPTELIKIKVTLKKLFLIDNQKKTCTVSLQEDVATQIRGKAFIHSRSRGIGSRDLEDCL